MYAFRSLLVTLISLLVFIRIDFAVASVYQCGLPSHFRVGTGKQDTADFYQSHLTVDLPDYGTWVYTYPGSDTITFGVTNVAVTFNGNVVYEMPGHQKTSPRAIAQFFQDRVSGVAQRKQISYTDSKISDCHIYLLPVTMDRLVVSSKIASEIRNLAETCIQSAICQRIGKMNTQYRTGSMHTAGLAQLPGLLDPMSYHFYGPMTLQKAFNTLMDRGLTNLVVGFRAKGQTKVSLPKIDYHFKVPGIFIDTKAHFEATNGIFSDLTTLVRKSPATVSHEGNKFSISSTFAFNTAKLRYSYKLKNGFKSTKGTLTATIHGVNVSAKLTADFTKVPCTTHIDSITVMNFGKIDSNFTNPGSLKSLIKKRKTWFDKDVLAKIGKAIETRLRSGVANEMYANCEMLRP